MSQGVATDYPAPVAAAQTELTHSHLQQQPANNSTTPSAVPSTAPSTINSQTTNATAIPLPSPQFKIAEDEPGNVKTVPFAYPVSTSRPAPPHTLSEEQQAKYDDLLAHITAIQTLPISTTKGAESAPLSDSERMWLTKECLLRYLRATKWVLAQAKQRLEGTLIWRREWGVEKHTAEYIEPENETGKQVILGYDNEARPCLYLNPARQNTEKSNRQVEHLVYMVERVLDIAPAGQETLALLVNFSATSSSKNPNIGQGKQVLNILQTHYPERLGRALVINIPWFVWGFFKLITPFIDPLTREKLKFNEALVNHVPAAQLLKEFGGSVDFTYTHAAYWPALIALAAYRKAEMEARWRQNGMRIGESEQYLKQGFSQDLHNRTIAATSAAEVESEMNSVTNGVASVAL